MTTLGRMLVGNSGDLIPGLTTWLDTHVRTAVTLLDFFF